MTLLIGAAFIKKLAGSEKKTKKVPRVFFQNKCSGTKTKVRSGCRRSPPPRQFCQFPSHRKSTPLASIAWNSYITQAILASQSHGGNTCACNCEARIKSSAIPVVKIAPQRPKLKIEDGKTSLSINLCLNASLRRTPVCHRKSGTGIILSAP